MKWFLTGANGMVGSALCAELVRRGEELVATDHHPADGMRQLDVTEYDAVQQMIRDARPDVVVHLAAETDVDRCERDPFHASWTNTDGTENVAVACRAAGARLVYVSTAAVFDGTKPTPYVETDTPNPLSVYARTKWFGEQAALQEAPDAYLVRAGWMIGGVDRDKKFVAKILQQLRAEKRLEAVTDKIGSPTFTEDFANGILVLVSGKHPAGLYHMANEGVCSRFDMACKIVELLGLKDVTVVPVTSDRFPLPAPRPRSEALENARLKQIGLGSLMRPWEDALRDYVEQWKARQLISSSSSTGAATA